MEELEFELIGASDPRVLEAIALGDKARKTVGLLPRAAYADAARNKRLLVASVDAEVIGYALYGLPRNEVTLTHLVVNASHRRQGIARALVEEISKLYHTRSGIRANCRKDYKLADMWTSLGFHPRLEIKGRGADRATIVVWYRNNPGHVDLLTPDASPLLRAAIDLNILRDLHDRPGRKGAWESLSLVEDHLADKLQLIATPQLYHEVTGIEDDQARNRYLAAMAHGYIKAHGDRRRAAELTREWIELARTRQSSYPVTAQDHEDAKHLGDAAACGAEVFVTRDEHLLQLANGTAQAALGISVLRPADVVLRIDELTRPDSYRPSDLHGTGYSRHEVSAQSEDELTTFQNVAERETKKAFLNALLTAATVPGHWNRTLIRDPEGRPVLLCVSGIANERLEVPLLRVDARHPISGTIVQHTLSDLRHQCRRHQTKILAITDPHLAAAVRRTALTDGFTETDSALIALVIDRVGPASQVQAAAEEAARRAGFRLSFALRAEMGIFAAAEVERTLWPAKVTDAQLPVYILPIQPRWSTVLFDVPPTLPLFRTEDWGLGREHVYYRSPNGPKLSAPARLLWYKSQGTGTLKGPPSIIGCSLLEEVVVDTPVALHTRFGRLGVWTQQDIFSAAKHGKAQALRFTHTEIFDTPPSGDEIRKIFTKGGLSGTIQGPRRISAELFKTIYCGDVHGNRATQAGHPAVAEA
ncbi:GNAT family N-acetyltransferase [Actinoallomurus acaciae]|uniref:GNAT family N-acetyltransferase n=1 Tax=Actinoallomurus acaciae TaxID=502577 RepID=A0ABV5YFJ1_9ACTN